MLIISKNPLSNGLRCIQYQSGRTSCWLEDYIEVPAHLESAAWDSMGYCDLQITDGVLTGITPIDRLPAPPEPSNYIPTPEQSSVVMMRSIFTTQLSSMGDDTILQCSGLATDWKPGNHTVGEVYNTRNGVHADGQEWEQTWECYQAYDNAVYQDIKPGNPSWYTFNRPLHGTSPETARPFVPVQGAHDMYHTGEYAVWTDGKIYHCKSDTNFSPEDYPQAWEVYSGQ